MEYDRVLKKENLAIWDNIKDLEGFMQSEMSQTESKTPNDVSYMWNFKKY